MDPRKSCQGYFAATRTFSVTASGQARKLRAATPRSRAVLNWPADRLLGMRSSMARHGGCRTGCDPTPSLGQTFHVYVPCFQPRRVVLHRVTRQFAYLGTAIPDDAIGRDRVPPIRKRDW